MFPTWWRNLVKFANDNGKTFRHGRRNNLKARRSWRPLLELLEDRLVPTTLSIPTTLSSTRGAIVTVPIQVDTLLHTGGKNGLYEGLSGDSFVIYYNQAVFTVSPSDVTLGTLATGGSSARGSGYSPALNNGWGGSALVANVFNNTTSPATNPTGTTGILIISDSTQQTGASLQRAASGTFVNINFHVNAKGARRRYSAARPGRRLPRRVSWHVD